MKNFKSKNENVLYSEVINRISLIFSDSRRLVKRAFDRFDNSGVFSFGAKRFDRYDDETAYGYGFDNHIFKRSADPYRFMSVPTKKAFDRMDNSDFFGAKRKRSFDRMGGTEFGLMKRSAPESRGRYKVCFLIFQFKLKKKEKL